MHELSIALSLIDVASQEAERRSARVVALHLKVGPLSGVVAEALRSAYELAREETPLADSRLEIEEAPIVMSCRFCNTNRPVVSMQSLCCSVCGELAAGLVGGDELELTALEIEA